MTKEELRQEYKQETGETAYEIECAFDDVRQTWKEFQSDYAEWLESKLTTHNGGLAKSCHNCGDKECKGVYETVGCWVA
jgi:plasmid maintenance system antidote protein VapI